MNNMELIKLGLEGAIKSTKFSDEAKELAYLVINDKNNDYLIGFLQMTEFVCALSSDVFNKVKQTVDRANMIKAMMMMGDIEND